MGGVPRHELRHQGEEQLEAQTIGMSRLLLLLDVYTKCELLSVLLLDAETHVQEPPPVRKPHPLLYYIMSQDFVCRQCVPGQAHTRAKCVKNRDWERGYSPRISCCTEEEGGNSLV